MNKDCQQVVFSDRAYNAIIRETFEWDPVETGGILLGHVLDNGCWIVMEVLPPGYGEGREGDNVYHEYGYFEYNRKFVNYLTKSVAEQYEIPLELLGLWHRHPGSMDHFSSTDDRTNSTFAVQNPHGVISALINVDPQLRMTMHYLSHSDAIGYGHPNYQIVEIEVGSDLIPEEYFKLRYYQGAERDLHPYAPQKIERREKKPQQANTTKKQDSQTSDGCNTEKHIDGRNIIKEQIAQTRGGSNQVNLHGNQTKPTLSVEENAIEKLKKNKKTIILILVIIAFLFYIINHFPKGFHLFEDEKKQSKTVIEQKSNSVKQMNACSPSTDLQRDNESAKEDTLINDKTKGKK